MPYRKVVITKEQMIDLIRKEVEKVLRDNINNKDFVGFSAYTIQKSLMSKDIWIPDKDVCATLRDLCFHFLDSNRMSGITHQTYISIMDHGADLMHRVIYVPVPEDYMINRYRQEHNVVINDTKDDVGPVLGGTFDTEDILVYEELANDVSQKKTENVKWFANIGFKPRKVISKGEDNA